MRRLVALLALAAMAACTRAKDASPFPPDATPIVLHDDAGASDAAIDAGDADATREAASDAASSDAHATAIPLSGKSVGHTSVVFKLKLSGGLEAVFKPRSRRGDARYRGEVAAYRLSHALRLDNVPLAILREFDAAKLKGVLVPDAAAMFEREAVVAKDGSITGALIPWVPQLEFLPLEAEPWSSRWRGWLGGSLPIPDDQRALAAQISTMVVFDWLTGNWDRWSGGNVGLDRARNLLLFIDNDGAFYEVPPADALARQLGILKGSERFSKSFVDALRALGSKELRAALADDLIPARALDGVEKRRTKALEIIDAKIAASKDASVTWLD